MKEETLTSAVTRRGVLKGGLVMAAGFALPGCSTPTSATGSTAESLIGFQPVLRASAKGKMPTISADYEYQVLAPWGMPLQPDGPAYQWPPSAEDQAVQMGIGHDGMTYFPLSEDGQRGLLTINHEFGRNQQVLGVDLPTSLEQVRASQHAHGVGIVEIENRDGRWQRIRSAYARRIHANTEVAFSGPAAGHAWLQNLAGNLPEGTFANCSNGQTPWGTYLTCEENFNLYFGATADYEPSDAEARYGFNAMGARYGWQDFDPRFDLSNPAYAGERHRFGWVVEIDPKDPASKPVKRTALGRFKHEGAAITVGRGQRAVAYMGDDQRFEFIYKFVSADDWQVMRAAGRSPLDEGVLYVARFNADGSGDWLPLTLEDERLAAHFNSQAELLIHARLAATMLGATPMDRPEWTSVAPDGQVYCTLTNNSERQETDAANPMAPNPHGHIIRWRDEDDHLGVRFTWDIFMMAADQYESEEGFGSPDGLWADPDGRVFIATDGKQDAGMHNQLLVANAETGKVARLLSGVPACEITGLTTTPDRRTLFVNVQHPGYGDPSLTNFPANTDGVTVPRDCTLAIRRKDGGIVGS